MLVGSDVHADLPGSTFELFEGGDEVLDGHLEVLRQCADPVADPIVEELYDAGRDAVVAANRALARLVRNGDPVPATLPAPLRDFFNTPAPLSGVSPDVLRDGALFYRRYALQIPIVLQFATMPLSYTSSTAVAALTFSGQLLKRPLERSFNTAQMVYDAMAINGFEPEGMGVRSCQKVRLMHSAVRYKLRRRGWDKVRHGAALNQEDGLGTLYAFSLLSLFGLARMGARFERQHAEAFHARWRVVGLMMGLTPEMLPTDLDDAMRLFARIIGRQLDPNIDTGGLMARWLEVLEGLVPHRALRPYVPAAIEALLGSKVARAHGLHTTAEQVHTARRILCTTTSLDAALPGHGQVRQGIDLLMWRLFMALFERAKGHKRTTFALPPL